MTGQLAAFADGAVFDDGASFALWTPPRFAIGRPRLKMFCCPISYERERQFVDFGSTPARRHILLETTDSGGGSQLDVWLATDHRGGVAGWLDASSWRGPMLPLSWSPAAGLDAPAALGWAVETFGRDNGRRFKVALAETCAEAWADLPR